ncbi:MAG TPA: hypothetical protein VMS17_04145, partial [Gemmataceae bacterium]|nr:hypothetical protein [Gemmataceae bacterium]
MPFPPSKFRAGRFLPLSLAFLAAAGTAAAQTPYSSTPPAGQTAAHGAMGVVYFEEPLPARPPVKPIPAAPPTAEPVMAAVSPEAPPAAVTEGGAPGASQFATTQWRNGGDCSDGACAGEAGCASCGRFGGRFGGKCDTCKGGASIVPPLGYYSHSIYAMQADLARANFF